MFAAMSAPVPTVACASDSVLLMRSLVIEAQCPAGTTCARAPDSSKAWNGFGAKTEPSLRCLSVGLQGCGSRRTIIYYSI